MRKNGANKKSATDRKAALSTAPTNDKVSQSDLKSEQSSTLFSTLFF